MQLTVSASITLAVAGTNIGLSPAAYAKALNAEKYALIAQAIGTAAEQLLPVTDIGTPGYLFAYNADATNYVDFGVDSSVATPIFRLKPLQFALIPVSSKTWYAKANTASCQVQWCLAEDTAA